MGATFVDDDKHIAQLCNQRCGGVHAKHTHLSLMAVWPHVLQVLGASSNVLSQQKGRTGRNRHQEKPPLEIVRDFVGTLTHVGPPSHVSGTHTIPILQRILEWEWYQGILEWEWYGSRMEIGVLLDVPGISLDTKR